MTRAALALCFTLLACSREPAPRAGAVASSRPPATPAPAAPLLELRLEGAAAFVTPAEIASCASERGEGSALLRCTLTPSGKDKLAEVTGKNLGKVMEMVVEGKVRMSPKIEQAMTGGQLTLWMGDDAKAAADAERLAAALSRR